MNKYIAIALFVVSRFIFASDLKLTVNPQEPVVGETFSVLFEITTDSDQASEPIITFSPLSVEVVGKRESGLSTRTTYINGKLSTEKTMIIEYEMLASTTGSAFLRDIVVEIGKEKIKHPTLRINIVSEPQRPRDIFVKAELDRDEYYQNQSIVLRYYLYSRIQLSATEIKKFPELNKFLKRYHQEQMNPQRVKIGNDIYTQRIVYTAQLFAQDPGEYVIDPITLNVEYTHGANPFGSIGFGGAFGQVKRRSISSKELRLTVKKLPVKDTPKNFTGLVGEHDFKFNIAKTKYITNEPIELSFMVEGRGALELFGSPRVINDSSVEEFDTTSDLSVREDFTAQKQFSYTYLPRSGGTIPAREMTFSYFDPDTLKFVEKKLVVPEIQIAALSTSQTSKNQNDSTMSAEPNEKSLDPMLGFELDESFFRPLYTLQNTYKYNEEKVVLVLLAILAFVALFFNFDRLKKLVLRNETLMDEIRKDGVNYSNLYQLVGRLGSGTDMRDIVIRSSLSDQAKEELIRLIKECEDSFKNSSDGHKLKMKRSVIKEINRKVWKRHNRHIDEKSFNA